MQLDVPVWLMWTLAFMLAVFPLSPLLMARSAKPEGRCANPLDELPEDVASGIIVINDDEYTSVEIIALYLAQHQMRERWGKDIDWID